MKKNDSPTGTNDPLRTLAEVIDQDGRIPVPEALKRLKVKREGLNGLLHGRPYRIGTEGTDEYVVSSRTVNRLKVIEAYLRRHPDGASVAELNKLVGISLASTQLYRLPDICKNIRRDRGVFTWTDSAHSGMVPKLEAVARAARQLLFDPEAARARLAKGRASARVREKIATLRDKRYIALTIDGGRTNSKVALELVKEAIPSPKVATVTYVTNYGQIEADILAKRKNRLHDPILVGGCRRTHSGTYVGRFAEACLRSYDVRPDVAFIATSTVSPEGEFGSSDFEESRFKAMMLGSPQSTLRCITADSTKILAKQSSGFAFASLADVDVVITDQAVATTAKDFLKLAHERGVLVVMGDE